ncbi:hypothetical protein T07_7734 [Trichinella nelsoni]|uniref:Uncharacterized protein n=1 Tax=Trichinella nelsoni TaxID=6336 RepID=A0A0V0S9C4_9BILA|nr:hypothetical protein T07_7734 [Trichinella nelsoni]
MFQYFKSRNIILDISAISLLIETRLMKHFKTFKTKKIKINCERLLTEESSTYGWFYTMYHKKI